MEKKAWSRHRPDRDVGEVHIQILINVITRAQSEFGLAKLHLCR